MKFSQKDIVKYLVVLIITGGIFWYLLRQTNLEDFRKALSEFNFWWIALSIGLSLISHLVRAWRWGLLLKSSGHRSSLLNNYFAVMIGYLANSVFPRLGEITRCGIVNTTDAVPIPKALGTVVTERVIDLGLLLLLTGITFLLQFNLLESYFEQGLTNLMVKVESNWWVLAILMVIATTTLYILFKSNLAKKFVFVKKIRAFIKDLWSGMMSIRNVKNQLGFWSSTLAIWVLYFLMLYVITFGSPLTQDLGILAGFSILVMGSFGMATPIPNGIGVFHTLVAGVLVLYGIDYDQGIIFATIMHTSQFITVLVIGSISLILVNVKNKKA